MMPYALAIGHVNYARYGLQYLRPMEHLTYAVLDTFLKGEHMMWPQIGIWNGVWSNMFIKTTFMCYGHDLDGIVGITLKQNALMKCALSLHVYK